MDHYSLMTRYVIHKLQISEHVQNLTGHTHRYVVWDIVEGKAVPFGNFLDYERAVARLERLNDL